MMKHGWTDYIPSVLWILISTRGLYKWRQNAQQMAANLAAVRANGKDELSILFARADQLMDNLRCFAFANGVLIGLLSLFVVRGWDFTRNLLFLRLYADYTLTVLIGSFFIFMLNGEIYGYVLDKVHGRR